ncbi:hypothetical protein HanIR_Chr17g0848101 [Helianthus annuus]|nr:hypothetical protein HanIR_Chr17g0848101 [Helianthus annuus]
MHLLKTSCDQHSLFPDGLFDFWSTHRFDFLKLERETMGYGLRYQGFDLRSFQLHWLIHSVRYLSTENYNRIYRNQASSESLCLTFFC